MFIFLQKRSVQTVILLSFFAVMMCLRAPDVFLYGRFWAEEGYVFFYHAWVMPPLQALFNIYGGYLNLPSNIITLLARWCIPLEYAPYFTSIIGLIFQLLPLFLLLTAKDKWLSPFQVRLLLTLLLLFVPESLETSLQSLHIQFQLTLTCAIILILNPTHSYQRGLKLIILLAAGLSGLMSIALLPLYFFRCWIDRDRLRFEEFCVLLISCSIQYFFFYENLSSRFHSFIINDFINIFFIHELYIPFVGINRYTIPYIEFLHTHMHSIHACLVPTITVIIFGISLIYIFHKKAQTRQAIFLFLSALFLFIISIIGSIGNRSDFLIPFINQRYLFISQSLLCIMLIYITYHLSPKNQKIGKAIIFWLIFIGSIHFFAHPSIFLIKAPQNYIPWQQQVVLWKNNPNYHFKIWPYWVNMPNLPYHSPLSDKK